MIRFEITTEERFDAVTTITDTVIRDRVRHTAARTRLDAQRSIEISPTAARPGEPAHSARGDLPKAIVFAAGDDEAIVGPMASVVGGAGEVHEKGGRFHDDEYAPRPYMVPAMRRQSDFFAESFEGQIGE